MDKTFKTDGSGEITFNKCDSLTYGENVVTVGLETYSEYEKIRRAELKAYLREIVREIVKEILEEEETMVTIE